MNARLVQRGAVIDGGRVTRTSSTIQNGQRMVVLHLDNGTARTYVPGAPVDVAPTRRLDIPAGVVRAPKRDEILPAINDTQTPGRDGRRGLATRRNP